MTAITHLYFAKDVEFMTGTKAEYFRGNLSKTKIKPDRTRRVIISHLFKEEPPDAPCITKPKSYQGKTLDSQKRMKAELLYLRAGHTVSRLKPFQGGGNLAGTETVPEPKLSQISNNCRTTSLELPATKVHSKKCISTTRRNFGMKPFFTEGQLNYSSLKLGITRKASRRKKL